MDIISMYNLCNLLLAFIVLQQSEKLDIKTIFINDLLMSDTKSVITNDVCNCVIVNVENMILNILREYSYLLDINYIYPQT